MRFLCRLGLHTRSRFFIVKQSGGYALTCKRCGKETP